MLLEDRRMVDELQTMSEIAKSMDSIEDKNVQKRILTWAWAKYVGGSPESTAEHPGQPKTRGRKKSSKKSGNKASRSKKKSFSMVKDLNLKPNGKDSLNDFVANKNPTTMTGRITVAVYYLAQTIGVEQVSVDHIYTCFKWMGWKLPAQFVNMIHQAGAKGWLETSDRENIMLTTLGENLVEHELSDKKE